MDPRRLPLLLEETRLLTALSSIRTQLNEHIPISTLPPEILEHIFALCVTWLFTSSFTPHTKKPPHPLAWTQVCRKWRYVSLSTPRLWSHIDVCGDDRLVAECLVRSADAPVHLVSSSLNLSLCQNSKYRAHARTSENLNLSLLAPYSERISSINVLLFPEDITHLLSTFPSLPHLAALSLKVPPVASNFLLRLPHTHLPFLRRLTLFSVFIPWTICAGLTHLHLRALVAGYAPTITQLLGVLRSSPCIEEVRLEHITPTPSDPTPPSQATPLLLASLHHLHLTSQPPFKIHTFLSHLSLPPSAHLSIACPHFERLRDLFPDTTPKTLFPHLSSGIGIEYGQLGNGFSLFARLPGSGPGDKFEFVSVCTQRALDDARSLVADIVEFFNATTRRTDVPIASLAAKVSHSTEHSHYLPTPFPSPQVNPVPRTNPI